MKKIKRILALLVAMVMVMGMTVTASAAASAGNDNKMGTADDTASVKIQGLNPGDVVKLYKIVNAKYESNGDTFSGYEVVAEFTSDLTLPTDSTTISFTADQIAAAAKTVDTNNIQPVKTITAIDTAVTINDLAAGSYLVKVTASDTTVYNPAVVSLYYTTDSIDEEILDLAATDNVWVKKQNAPTLDKWILENGTKVKGNSVDAGDTVTYVIEATIPSYTGEYPVYEIVDTLEKLTYVETKSVEIVSGDEVVGSLADKEFAYDETRKNLFMNFVTDGEYELQQYQGYTLRIVYTATLDDNETANMFNESNDNTAYLKYTNDASAEKEPVKTENAVTHTYTFEITDFVQKTDMDGNPLNGAEFTLYTDESCTNVYENDNFTGTVISADGGKLVIKGLDAGTYYLKETEAPEGYALNNTVFKVEIIEEDYANDGTLGKCTVKIQDNEIDAETPYLIKNTKISSLPSTGGIGTTIFTIGGCVIMIAAAGLFFASRRKSAK